MGVAAGGREPPGSLSAASGCPSTWALAHQKTSSGCPAGLHSNLCQPGKHIRAHWYNAGLELHLPGPRHSVLPCCTPLPPAVTTPMWRTVNGLTYCNADGEQPPPLFLSCMLALRLGLSLLPPVPNWQRFLHLPACFRAPPGTHLSPLCDSPCRPAPETQAGPALSQPGRLHAALRAPQACQPPAPFAGAPQAGQPAVHCCSAQRWPACGAPAAAGRPRIAQQHLGN